MFLQSGRYLARQVGEGGGGGGGGGKELQSKELCFFSGQKSHISSNACVSVMYFYLSKGQSSKSRTLSV